MEHDLQGIGQKLGTYALPLAVGDDSHPSDFSDRGHARQFFGLDTPSRESHQSIVFVFVEYQDRFAAHACRSTAQLLRAVFPDPLSEPFGRIGPVPVPKVKRLAGRPMVLRFAGGTTVQPLRAEADGYLLVEWQRWWQ